MVIIVYILSCRLKQTSEKPLLVLLSWLLAKKKHVEKYAQLYLDQGFEVLHVSITPWQLLWPVKGSQIVAADVVKFLEQNVTYHPLVLHGFSVGGYVWGECLVHMARNMERYKSVINRIEAQVWDSAADITEIPEGVPFAMFPKNKAMQQTLRKYML